MLERSGDVHQFGCDCRGSKRWALVLSTVWLVMFPSGSSVDGLCWSGGCIPSCGIAGDGTPMRRVEGYKEGVPATGESITDGLENMDCGAVQPVGRGVEAACASVEENYKGRHNSEAQQVVAGRTSNEDDKHTGRPSSCTTPAMVAKPPHSICQNRRRTIQDFAKEMGISFGFPGSVPKMGETLGPEYTCPLINIENACRCITCVCVHLQDNTLWACLAAMAVYGRELETAEEAYAAIDEVDKVFYLQNVKKIPIRAAQLAEMALLSGNVSEAENLLLQNGFVFRAIMTNLNLHNWNRQSELPPQLTLPGPATYCPTSEIHVPPRLTFPGHPSVPPRLTLPGQSRHRRDINQLPQSRSEG
uniref:IFT80/172/WDR35 TPR domain-containing protein n=1 Tax=Timema monikensis TaxID=170555 RepID=A0A7R9E033_9NEOP|nr:unnamed protein product [Timema monikensis]